MTGHRVYLISALLLFVVMGLLYGYFTPLWNPPDEESHYAYCEQLARKRSLPHAPRDSAKDLASLSFHPPLYYFMGSFLCREQERPIYEVVEVNDGPGYSLIEHPESETAQKTSAHLLRFATLLMSTITVAAIYLMMLTLFPGEKMPALAAALFAGMNPQFIHVSASVSNEPLAAAFSTLYLFALLHYVKGQNRPAILLLLGLLLGGCLLAKTSTVFWIPVTACIVISVHRHEIRKLFTDLAIVFSTAALAAGWWYAQNWTTLSTLQTSQPWFMRRTPVSSAFLQEALYNTFASFFGCFGALQIPLFSEYLMLYGALLLIGCSGLVLLLVRGGLQSSQQRLLFILLLSLAGGMGVFILLNYKFYAFLGKYLFVVMAPIALCTFTGLRGILPEKWRTPFFTGLSVLLIAITADTLVRIVRPSYAEPGIRACADQPLFCCSTAPLNEQTAIGQTFIASEENLCALRVMFSSAQKAEGKTVTLSLREAGGREGAVRSLNLPHKKIKDNTRYFFIFPPISSSKGKEYTFTFTSTASAREGGAALWYESADCYPEGRMVVNGEPAGGDLYFTAYYSISRDPGTEWQGKKYKVIRQGQYVNARELQLYYQRSKEFREKTITHEKILRFTKAKRK